MHARSLWFALLLPACDPVVEPAPVCFTESEGQGADASTGASCNGEASPIGYSLAGPNVHLLVDRSASMGGNRWSDVQALTAFLPAVGERANLALSLFPSSGQCGVDGPSVPMGEGPEASAEAAAMLLEERTGGKTPMADALHELRRDPGLHCPNRDNVVVVLTDGLETCGGSPRVAMRRLAESDPPVEIYVIGFGVDDRTADELEDLAREAEISTPTPNFYRAESAGDLVERLQAVTGTCKVQLHEDVAADALAVTMDGVALSTCNEDRCEGGYSFDPEHRTVSFEGADCLALLDGTCHDLRFDRR